MANFVFALSRIFVAVMINGVVGAAVGSLLGFDAAVSAGVANVVAVVVSAVGMPVGAMRVGVLTEIWTGEMIKAFRTAPEQLGWYDRIRSFDQYVNNDVIHFTELGGDPEVLVNNNTYPLEVESLQDADKPVSLDKYDTKPTSVTDDELHAVSYDRMASVLERHREALKAKVVEKALHAIAPQGSGEGETIVLRTSGEVVAAEKRRKMVPADIIALKRQFDAHKMPAADRVLVLSSEHVNDLLETDQKFKEAYNINQTEGKIARLYGFDIYEMVSTPQYTAAGAKRAFEAKSTDENARQCSVAFYVPGMMRANGSVQFYHQEAVNDPLYHRNLVNFRKWGICLPLKAKWTRGAIVSSVEA